MLTKDDIKIIKNLLEEREERLGKQISNTEKILRIAISSSEFSNKRDLETLEKRLKNDIVLFKDQILSEIIKLRDDLTMVEGWRQMMADQEEEIEKIKAAIHL